MVVDNWLYVLVGAEDKTSDELDFGKHISTEARRVLDTETQHLVVLFVELLKAMKLSNCGDNDLCGTRAWSPWSKR